MILKLQITTNVKGDVFELVLKKSKYRVGRRFDNDLRIKESYVSAYHAEIHKDEDENYTLVDKDSSNGTFVNGNRVKGPKAVPVVEGDYIKFGNLKVKVASYEDTGPKVVALGERESATKAMSPTQPLKTTTKPIPPTPKAGSVVSDKTAPFASAAIPPSTSKVATDADRSGKADDLAAVSLKLAAVEKERDTLQQKAESLEKKIQAESEQAKATQKKSKDSSADAAKKVTRITKEFASKEGYLTDEISKLKKALELAEKNASKVGIIEKSKEKSDELVTDLQKQIADFRKAQELAREDHQKLVRESGALTGNLELEKAEKDKLSLRLDEKIAAAAMAANLVGKLEKDQIHRSENGEKEVGNLRDQISRLESQIKKDAADRKKLELDIRDRADELKLSGKERAALESDLKKQIEKLELDVKSEQAKVENVSSGSKKAADEVTELKDQLADVQKRLHESELENSAIRKEAEANKATVATQIALAVRAEEKGRKSEEKISDLEKSLSEAGEEFETIVKEKAGEGEAATALAMSLASVEMERDSFQQKISSLKKEIEGERAKADKAQRQSQVSSGNDAKEIARISSEFAASEEELKSEIAGLKQDLDTAEKDAVKAKIAEEEAIVGLQSQVAELKKEQKLAIEGREKADRESKSLLGKLGEESNEKQKQYAELEANLHSTEEGLRKEKEGRETEVSNFKLELVEQGRRYQKLAKSLKDTQEGLSGVLRNAWNQRDEQKSLFQSNENRKLSEADEALTKAIHGREKLADTLAKLEKQLVVREEKEEKLRDKIEGLESRLGDNHQASGELAEQVEVIEDQLSAARKAHAEEIKGFEARIQIEKEEQVKAGKEVEDAKERCLQLSQAAEAMKIELEKEIIEWEKKFKRLKTQKASLAKETENFSDIEEAISRANAEKKKCDDELAALYQDAKKLKSANSDLEKDCKLLQDKKTELDSGLLVARSELNNVQKRSKETRSQEEKLTLRIGAAEKRVQTLKHLETELEQALDRKRGSKGLHRKDVFTSLPGESAAIVALDDATTEETFCRKLISKLDLLDDLTIRYGNKWRYPKVSEQLSILKGSFLDLLKEHSVDQFQIKPGTVLSLEERKRIKLIHNKDEKLKKPVINGNGNDDGQPRVVDTLRPGYIYQNGGNSVIIRKAEVVVA